MADDKKTGFWGNVFDPSAKLFRGGIFIACLSIFLVCLAVVAYWFFVKPYLVAIDNIEITPERNLRIVFGGGGKNSTVVVDVPGSEVGVPSGVPLEKDKVIKITASGVVLTDATAYFKDTPGQEKKKDLLEKLNSRIIGWRRPDGRRLNYIDKDYEENIMKDEKRREGAEESDKLILLKGEEYGCLLGIVSLQDDSTRIDSVLLSEKTVVFRIGEQATINFKGGQFVIDSIDKGPAGEKKITTKLDKKYEGHNIYFVVNDCIVRSKDDLRKVLNANRCDAKEIELQLEIYRELEKSKTGTGKTIWYGDNMGHFIVLVETKPAGKFP